MSRLIDADKLKAHYSWWANSTNYDLCEMKYVVDDIVDVQPTIDPVRHGHWIEDGYNDYKPACSECGCHSEENNFCPNCGAKMDGGKDDD